MAEQYRGMAIGIFELDSECACFVAVSYTHLTLPTICSSTDPGSGEKSSGSRCMCEDAWEYFRCKSSYGGGDPYGRANRKSCFPHGDRIPVRGDRNGDCNDDYKIRRD